MKNELFPGEEAPLLASNTAKKDISVSEDEKNSRSNRTMTLIIAVSMVMCILVIGMSGAGDSSVTEEISHIPISLEGQTGKGCKLQATLPGYGCDKFQAKQLGTGYKTPQECAVAAHADSACSGNEIMFAPVYNYAWGCRCCKPKPSGSVDAVYSKNPNWDVYKYTAPTKAVTVYKRLPSYGCDRFQAKQLGTGHKTPEACAAAAMADPACSGNEIMFAPVYNYAWGCRCCKPKPSGQDKDVYSANRNWDTYKYVGAVKAVNRLPGYGCDNFQAKNLGTNFKDAGECADAAFKDSACTSNEIMWSGYSYAWGCRCCKPKPAGSDANVYSKNQNWNIYQYNLPVDLVQTCAPPPPTPNPTPNPTPKPTSKPTSKPTPKPTGKPTLEPTNTPTAEPTVTDSSSPTISPTSSPTESPTSPPTSSPTESPTSSPTESPTFPPTLSPTESPTAPPTLSPTESPTSLPTPSPTKSPTASPTISPEPSATPTSSPTPNECVDCVDDTDCKAGGSVCGPGINVLELMVRWMLDAIVILMEIVDQEVVKAPSPPNVYLSSSPVPSATMMMIAYPVNVLGLGASRSEQQRSYLAKLLFEYCNPARISKGKISIIAFGHFKPTL
eukprot:CAMPEP_0195285058 /NCGR_PEP_ID=MMETSP0707-20130614/3026_1 /TAXON_ID=33640 /ORGANISM="Asterionellopsis glacialis, Strain CCMP134" /LENGTH=612 /DNA_ID=CAMNT_0040344489 /DNA_START=72 /DNA_END=1911 /DNA_ORIENTATION=-